MTAAATVPLKSSASTRAAAHGGDEDEDEDDDDDEDAQFINQAEYEEMDFAQEVAQALDPAEEAIMAKFMTKEPKKQINLANLIMSKIEEAERDAEEAVTMAEIQRRREEDQRAEAVAAAGGAMRPHMPIRRPTAGLNPKLTKVYRQVGLYLSKYKSGKLPKTFKIIPTLTNWEEILFLTQPYDWTPQATCAAVRVFTASLKDKQAQRFFCLVLLDKVRGDIAENKKLNYHYYMAIKKAIYKPAAFFKGFLLPLLEAGPTLRETAIVCSVLMRISIPMLHSAAAVLKIAELEYTGPASLVLRTLLEKKYALPYRVLDALVLHFVQFQRDEREMPVLWHQSLLVFVQRYKNDISEEQRDALMALLRVKKHRLITDEIRRELMTTIHADMAMDQSAGMTRDAVLKQFELAPPAPMALF
ncbi:hypothetical protein CXG81DRAFT_13783 [Caulochytrium protostelioides]|uniref:Bystin n=1 Tax=Caulochytrium protostelioides TaxID=1555241 RepID=A0A4P9X4H8_9FUNG|nr:hypothetical protein CXG81DRAFT_13783 [Caulochytrium protostelioides]|eukprot:RKO99972.1 hypothetical protein CXG81DRAFT_13783 [Caulochytrium protostelioides]